MSKSWGALALLRAVDPKDPVWALRNALRVIGHPITHDAHTIPFIDVAAAAQYLQQHPIQNIYLPSIAR